MRRKPITSAEEYAAGAEKAEQRDDWKWTQTVQVEPAVWHDVLDRFPELEYSVVNHHGLPDDVLIRLSRWPNCDVRSRLDWSDRRLPHAAIESLLRDIDPDVRAALSWWRWVTLEQVLFIYAGSTGAPHPGILNSLKHRFAVSWRDLTPQPTPPLLSPYEDVEAVRKLLSDLGYSNLDPSHPDCNDDWLSAVAESSEAANWIAYSGLASAGVIAGYAASGYRGHRQVAAQSPSCPAEVLAALALDYDGRIRRLVARHFRTDIPTLLLLASDDSDHIVWSARDALDKRFGVQLPVLRSLPIPQSSSWPPISSIKEFASCAWTADPMARIRYRFGKIVPRLAASARLADRHGIALVRNQTVPDEGVLELLPSRCSRPSSDMTLNLRRLESVSFWGRAALAERASSHSDWRLRWRVAKSKHTPRELLERLASEPDDLITDDAKSRLREEFAVSFPGRLRRWNSHRFQSAAQFVELCQSDSPEDREKATRRKAAQPSMWREVLERAPDLAKWVAINETVGPRLLDELADWPDPEVRRWVCDHPRVWLKTLHRLAFEADPSVRRRAVYNSRLSDKQLRRLRHDADPEVAAEATRRLAAREYANRLLNDPEWWRHLGNSEVG